MTFRMVTTIWFILGLSVTRVVYGEKCGGIRSYLLARFIVSREFLRNVTIFFRFFYESMSRQVEKLTRAIRVVIQFNMSGYTVCFSKYHDTSLYILTLEERKYIMQDVFDYKNKIRF